MFPLICYQGYKKMQVVDNSKTHAQIVDIPNDKCIQDLLKRTGLYHYSVLGWMGFDWHLLTTFVKRWRSETNTFYLLVGEMTVTLQDVAFITGLCVNGSSMGGAEIDVRENVDSWFERLLG